MEIINTILTVLSIIITGISILLGVNFEIPRDVYRNIFLVLVLMELVVIGLLCRQRRVLGYEIPKINKIADQELFKNFWKQEIIEKDSVRRKNMRNGFLRLFGGDVERIQALLIEFLNKSEKKKYIYAADITSNPHILLTRNDYHKMNRIFIQQGNEIRRIFIIDDKKLTEISYVNDLYKVLMLNKQMKVQTGMIITTCLKPDEIRDFIIYDKSAVIVEGHQATEKYVRGDSQLWFLTDSLDEFQQIFMRLEKRADVYNQSNKFIQACRIIDGEVVSFDLARFLNSFKNIV